MTQVDSLDQGRRAFTEHAWAPAYTHLVAADEQSPLSQSDLQDLATAAYLLGKDEISVELWARCFQSHLDSAESPAAARCAFWAAFQLLNAGEIAQGSAWLTRAVRLLDECPDDCVERGYVLAPMGIQQIEMGELETARGLFTKAEAIGHQFADPNLLALAHLGQGQVNVMLGNAPAAVELFDEVMVCVTTGEVAPVVAGIAYCATIMACQELFDLRRANEWTRALSRWCEDQPDLVAYRGQCLVHRAELMQLQGSWPDAMREVVQARKRLADPPGQAAIGMAYYQQGELHRLRGEFAQAEKSYRQANKYGHQPQPGLALLWLAQDRIDVATQAASRALEEAADRVTRSKLLPAYVEIMIASGAVDLAAAGAAAIAELAEEVEAPLLTAMSAHASGAVALASDDPKRALEFLRRAWSAWQQVESPYEAARVRVLIGLSCRALGDEDSASMEFDAAAWAFQQLGAVADIVQLERHTSPQKPTAVGSLTAREVQVLTLLATGATNRAIAVDLVISEKTVARHVSNIFSKLGVTSRSAATAYAYEHGIV
ncbi:MAG TPA: response regulator transcription factor [Actinomycetes bacterium]|nr:response regulator transcription factor [Actinomycetes bacterium]